MNGTFGLWTSTTHVCSDYSKISLYIMMCCSTTSTMSSSLQEVQSHTPIQCKSGCIFSKPTLPQGVSYVLRPAGATSQVITSHNWLAVPINLLPSATIPEMSNPEIVLESTASAFSSLLTVTDLVTIRNHILGTQPLCFGFSKISCRCQ